MSDPNSLRETYAEFAQRMAQARGRVVTQAQQILGAEDFQEFIGKELPDHLKRKDRFAKMAMVFKVLRFPTTLYARELYFEHARQIISDNMRGVDVCVCSGSPRLAEMLIEVFSYNEREGSLTRPVGALLGARAVEMQKPEHAWAITIKNDKDVTGAYCYEAGTEYWLMGTYPLREYVEESITLLDSMNKALRRHAREHGDGLIVVDADVSEWK